ncbi:MAG: DUF4411 family protein [Candidatus Thorarchaeota archaeon]|jgi:hypothetical protein
MYSFDTSAFINPWKNYYQPQSFPKMWKLIDSLIQQGTILASEMVYHELKVQKDDLLAWVKERTDSLIVKMDEGQQLILEKISGDFPRFVNHDSPARDYADPFVVALAIQRELCVVTDEKRPKKGVKIPNVCDFYKIRCISFQSFLDEVGYKDL